MASRPVGNGNISFGLVSIPVRLFPATRSKAVSFNLLHAKDNSRIQQKIFCPVDNAIIDRNELVRGYEVAKGRYVTFTDEELKALEARGGDHSIDITEFVPLEQIDPIYFETSYYLGCEQGSAKAYRLLTDALPYPIEDASPLEAARLICGAAPVPPSDAVPLALQPKLRGDLDTILLQALRKEPDRRYRSGDS